MYIYYTKYIYFVLFVKNLKLQVSKEQADIYEPN